MAEIVHPEAEEHHGRYATAAIAMKNLFFGDGSASQSSQASQTHSPDTIAREPLDGWSDGVSLRKGHFCLLLKPQVILRSAESKEAICILAAIHGTLKTFAIMDDANAEDPACGKIMNRCVCEICDATFLLIFGQKLRIYKWITNLLTICGEYDKRRLRPFGNFA